MSKKMFFILLLLLFLYVTTFNVFITETFKLPAPAVFLSALLMFYGQKEMQFVYGLELMVLITAVLLYQLIGEQDISSFFAISIVLMCFALFFNYVIGSDIQKFILAITIFYSLLLLSGLVMFLDHQYHLATIRGMLIGAPVLQSPSGISATVFGFGYQMATLTPFLFTAVILFRQKWLVIGVSILVIACLIFFGMQRSVLVAFGCTATLVLIYYYRARSILLGMVIAMMLLVAQNFAPRFSADKNQQNILNKNIGQADKNQMRGSLMSENLSLIADYPFGLIFYGKRWNDVVQHNFVYKSGTTVITSHNAYLMFITYLGPVLGVIFLLLVYFSISKIVVFAFISVKKRETALLCCLCASFVGVSINAFFHNEWLLIGSGPTLFLYFAILHLYRLTYQKNNASGGSLARRSF